MRWPVLTVLFSLLFIASASAVWVPQGAFEVHEGEQLHVAGLQVSIASVDPGEGMVSVIVKRGGVILGRGDLFLGETYEISELLKISIDSLPQEFYYGEQATLRFSAWADARISFTNFPDHMNYNDRYPVYAVIENIGPTELKFAVELTEPGNYARVGRTYETAEHETITELLKVDRPIQFVTIPAGGYGRADWLIGPNRRQSSYTDTTVKVGDVQFNLYAGDEILDSLTHYSVKASTEQSGFITDIIVPSVLIRDVPVDAHAILQNTGYAQGGINSKNFGLRVISAGFVMDPRSLYGQIGANTRDEWGFRLRGLSPGEHILSFQFTLTNTFTTTEQVLDTFSIPVTVIDGYSTRITDISVPSDVRLGEKLLIGAVIENLGNERHVDVVLDAPALAEIPLKQRLILPPNRAVPVSFIIEATTYGDVPLTLTLYDREGTKENTNIDPYSRGREIARKDIKLVIPDPRGLPPRSSLAVRIPETTVPSSAAGAVATTPAPAKVPIPEPIMKSLDIVPDQGDQENYGYLALLIAGILVLVGIVIVIVFNEFSKRP